jgi:hypothetical protein
VKIIELFDRPSVALSNDQMTMLKWVKQHAPVDKSQLEPHQLWLIDQLVAQDLVVRRRHDRSITYDISPRII